jgi:hypothetical protein
MTDVALGVEEANAEAANEHISGVTFRLIE